MKDRFREPGGGREASPERGAMKIKATFFDPIRPLNQGIIDDVGPMTPDELDRLASLQVLEGRTELKIETMEDV